MGEDGLYIRGDKVCKSWFPPDIFPDIRSLLLQGGKKYIIKQNWWFCAAEKKKKYFFLAHLFLEPVFAVTLNVMCWISRNLMYDMTVLLDSKSVFFETWILHKENINESFLKILHKITRGVEENHFQLSFNLNKFKQKERISNTLSLLYTVQHTN